MNLVSTLISTLILILIVSIATGYLTKAASDMKVGNDPNQIKAHSILTGAATFGWISVALLLGAGFLYMFYGAEASTVGISTGSLIALSFICIVFFVNGILAMFAAIYMKKGVNFSDNQGPYNICVWVAVLFLGTTGLLAVYEIYKVYKKQALKAKTTKGIEAAIELQERKQLIENLH
jgi:hypothetical protein